MVMPYRKTIIRQLELRICLFMFLLHTLYITITEIRVYKYSTVVSLHCLSCRTVTEHHNVLHDNKTVFYRLHKIYSSRRNFILTIEIRQ